MPKTIRLTRYDKVLKIELNRPEELNALNKEVLKEILEHVVSLDADPDLQEDDFGFRKNRPFLCALLFNVGCSFQRDGCQVSTWVALSAT